MSENNVQIGAYVAAAPLAERTAAAQRLAKEYQHAFATLPYKEPTPRLRLSLTLFAVSIAHAYTIATVLHAHPGDHGASALALFRPQIEALLRGILFATPEESTDADVERFLADDVMPVRGEGKQRRPITLAQMASITTRYFEKRQHLPDPAGIERMIVQAAKALNGFTHGGRQMVGLHARKPNLVEFVLSEQQADWLLRNSSTLAAVPWVLAGELFGTGEFDANAAPKVREAQNAFVKSFGIAIS
ncbi:DUF6988 family protein [Dyella sp.]|uniref:DUF6988 family protein n=1 Tax=Dyella sp. TaxID=1869338 RepID=UPI003F803C9D